MLTLLHNLFFTSAASPSKVMKRCSTMSYKKSKSDFVRQYRAIQNPTIQEYVRGMQLKQVQNTWNPIKKINVYKNYKDKLNRLIDKNLNHVHGRYVRFLVEQNVPKKISSTEPIKGDRLFLKKYLFDKKETEHLLIQDVKLNSRL